MTIDIIDELSKLIISHFPKSYNFTYKVQKHQLKDILTGILYVLKTGIAWKDYFHINGNTLHFHHMRFCNKNIYAEYYKRLLDLYLSNDTSDKLSIQLTDTTFINNLNGTVYARKHRLFRSKRVCKVSVITDKYGIPLSLKMCDGGTSDSVIFLDNLDKFLTQKSISVKEKKLLADSAYDSNKVREKLTEMGYTHVIKNNKRNIKDKKKLKLKAFTEEEEKIYKKRVRIEYFFAYLKQFKRVRLRSDRLIRTFMGFVYLGSIKILARRL